MSYTDSHAHLDDERYSEDREEVVQNAGAAGVERILTIGLGTKQEDFQRTITLVEQNSNLWAALGIHPHDAKDASPALQATLEGMVQHRRVLAWGEIGLDYHYDNSPRKIQQKVFREQLQLARGRNLPVIIHCREAWEDCLGILDEEWASSGLGGIFHCFSGTEAEARKGIEQGFLISFAGVVTFAKADDLRGVAKSLPRESLLIETDCPYLAPKPHRGKRNEPAYVVEVAGELARLHGISPEEMGAATTENFLRLFPKARTAS